ncbi:unnamed protein product [Brassica rapa subsp. trilocularis]
MEHCLATSNLQAHYIHGIQEYFHNNNIDGACHSYTSQQKVRTTTLFTFTV